MASDRLTLTCPAKVNLALAVGPPDPVTRMHPICSWMVAVYYGDTMELARAGADTSTFKRQIAEETAWVSAIDWPLEDDLMFRAHALLEKHVGRALPVEVSLHKRIPSGAGLGGGSSNAATMLNGLNQLFDLSIPEQTLFDLGMSLGSDVGYLVVVKVGHCDIDDRLARLADRLGAKSDFDRLAEALWLGFSLE